jgi:hypothetical protein
LADLSVFGAALEAAERRVEPREAREDADLRGETRRSA